MVPRIQYVYVQYDSYCIIYSLCLHNNITMVLSVPATSTEVMKRLISLKPGSPPLYTKLKIVHGEWGA